MHRLALATLATTLLFACGDDDPLADGGLGVDGGADASADGATDAGHDAGERCVEALPVDILWVVDNSSSMAQEQANLAAQFPSLVDTLTDPPDADNDGYPDYPAVTDLHMAVVTTDVGTADQNVTGCTATGDDGVFVSTSRATEGDCVGFSVADGASFLSFGESLASDFACLVDLGTDGCGIEQQLEASHRALFGHAEDSNAGFLRDGSLVLVMFVTDEDDCSTDDTALFDPTPAAAATLGPFPRRCAEHPDRLYPVSRYTSAIHELEERATVVMVGAITGVPRDLTSDPADVDYDAVLADDRMQIAVDPDDSNALAPACEYGGVGSAPPARRIVELVQDFDDSLLASICEPDLSDTMRAIGTLVAERLCEAPI